MELAGLLIKLGGESVGGVLAFAAAKDDVLLEQEGTALYPANRADVFVPNITFDIDRQILRLKFGKIIARAVINICISDAWAAG